MVEPENPEPPNSPNRGEIAFTYAGVEVPFSHERLINLTRMWEAVGRLQNKDPRKWRTKEGRGFVADLARHLNVPVGDIIRAQRGRGGATWAHWQVALAYAKYLSNDFHRFVNEAFREWAEEEFDPDLKVKRAVERYRKRGWDDQRIIARIEGIIQRRRFTDALQEHGVSDEGYPLCTNAVYVPVLGKTARELRRAMGLSDKARLRDHLSTTGLTTVSWTETMALECIKARGASGNAECLAECSRVAEAAKIALKSLGIDTDKAT